MTLKLEALISEKNEIKKNNDNLCKEIVSLKQKLEIFINEENNKKIEENDNYDKDEEIAKLKKELKEIQEEKIELINTKNEISSKRYEFENEIKKLDIELQKVNNELKDQISKNELIEKELENYKKINSQILAENSMKQEKINEYINNNLKTEDKNNMAQKIEELNQVIEKKDKEIGQLKEEIEKNKKKKNKIASPFSGFNKNSSFGESGNLSSHVDRISVGMGEDGINDSEKIQKYVERFKEYKNEIEAEQQLTKILKEDIKNLKQKLNEIIKLFNLSTKDYKPKKKEQKEALEQLKNYIKIIN